MLWGPTSAAVPGPVETFSSLGRVKALSAVLLAAALTSSHVCGQRTSSRGESFGGNAPSSETAQSGIAWYGVLQDGLQEAQRTDRPILLLTAAPQCNGVPGMW